MSPFIETIRVENGKLPMLAEHQKRINASLSYFGYKPTFSLENEIIVPESYLYGIYKCRIIYDLRGILRIEFYPYEIRTTHSFALVDIGDYAYPFKYEDREWINDFIRSAKTDEIIMYKKDRITDSSYANLAFYDGSSWVTPRYPLLYGTRRSLLLKKGILAEKDIRIGDLRGYSQFKCINAMMTWEESPVFGLDSIKEIL